MNTLYPKLRNAENPQSSRTQDNVDSVVRPVAAALTNTPIMGAKPPAWILPDLLNGFANAGGIYAAVGYHKDALGYVHCKGVMAHAAGTAAGTQVMLFAPGYRPGAVQRFTVEGTAATAQFIAVNGAGVAAVEVLIAAGGTCDFAFSFLAEQ